VFVAEEEKYTLTGLGLRPHAGVSPLHPVLTRLRSAINFECRGSAPVPALK
jgi:hypothetical protein